MKKCIFGMPRDEILRQCEANALMCDSNSPLRLVEELNPCVEGGKKILADEKSRKFFSKIYTGSNCDE